MSRLRVGLFVAAISFVCAACVAEPPDIAGSDLGRPKATFEVLSAEPLEAGQTFRVRLTENDGLPLRLLEPNSNGDFIEAYELSPAEGDEPAKVTPVESGEARVLAFGYQEGDFEYLLPDEFAEGTVLLCDTDMVLNCVQVSVR